MLYMPYIFGCFFIIVVELSGFGLEISVPALNYDGFTAKWVLTNVICNPTDGKITVTVTANEKDTNSGTITSDNTEPKVTINKPVNGLYLFNRKIFPLLKRPIIIGPITFELEIEDVSGVSKVEYYIDSIGDTPDHTVYEEPFSWNMNRKLLGDHYIKILVYDHAGNINSQTITLFIFNFI